MENTNDKKVSKLFQSIQPQFQPVLLRLSRRCLYTAWFLRNHRQQLQLCFLHRKECSVFCCWPLTAVVARPPRPAAAAVGQLFACNYELQLLRDHCCCRSRSCFRCLLTCFCLYLCSLVFQEQFSHSHTPLTTCFTFHTAVWWLYVTLHAYPVAVINRFLHFYLSVCVCCFLLSLTLTAAAVKCAQVVQCSLSHNSRSAVWFLSSSRRSSWLHLKLTWAIARSLCFFVKHLPTSLPLCANNSVLIELWQALFNR